MLICIYIVKQPTLNNNSRKDMDAVMKILVTATSFNPERVTPALERLREFADEIVFNPQGRPLTEDELAPLLAGCDGYIAGLDFITDRALAGGDRLKVISRYGVGVDRVDLGAAKARGIRVCNTPGATNV